MGNPLLENKSGSFHWAPIFPHRNAIITLGNFSTIKDYKKEFVNKVLDYTNNKRDPINFIKDSDELFYPKTYKNKKRIAIKLHKKYMKLGKSNLPNAG